MSDVSEMFLKILMDRKDRRYLVLFFTNKILSEMNFLPLSAVQTFIGKFFYVHVISLEKAILKQLKIFWNCATRAIWIPYQYRREPGHL